MQNFGYAFSLRTKREHTTGSALKPPIHRVFKRRVYFEPLMVHHTGHIRTTISTVVDTLQ